MHVLRHRHSPLTYNFLTQQKFCLQLLLSNQRLSLLFVIFGINNGTHKNIQTDTLMHTKKQTDRHMPRQRLTYQHLEIHTYITSKYIHTYANTHPQTHVHTYAYIRAEPDYLVGLLLRFLFYDNTYTSLPKHLLYIIRFIKLTNFHQFAWAFFLSKPWFLQNFVQLFPHFLSPLLTKNIILYLFIIEASLFFLH